MIEAGKSFADVLVRKVPTALLHDGRRGERNGCIVQLMVAKQRQLQRVEALPVEDLAGQIVGEQMNIGKIRLVKRCTDLFAPRLDHGLDRRRFTVNDRVAAGLDDAGLCCGDLLQRVAQHLRVVKADVADDCNLRRQNHVCGVKFAAHADLTDNEVTISNSVGCSKIESARGLIYSVISQISSSGICTPSIWMRSLKRIR